MKVVGSGPDVLLIHGSATDRSTWAIQLASHPQKLRMMAPNRPGADGRVISVSDQADLLAAAAAAHDAERFVVVGSSFGAVVALEMARRHSDRVRGIVLIEPPLAPSDAVPAVPEGFGCRFDAITAVAGGEAAAEMFLRAVIGDAAFERFPEAFRKRSVSTWRHIRADSMVLGRYHVDYPRLRAISTPTLLVGGELSLPRFGLTLDALEAAIPAARREVIEGAGHMLHAESPRRFGALLGEFVLSVT